jgi:hypothetical protein
MLSPFNKHADITGDLLEGVETRKTRQQIAESPALSTDERKRERKYIKGVLAIYGKDERTLWSPRGLRGPDLADFHLKLFMYKAQYSLRSKIDKSLSAKLKDIRMSAEWSRMKIEDLFANMEMKASEFVNALNRRLSCSRRQRLTPLRRISTSCSLA